MKKTKLGLAVLIVLFLVLYVLLTCKLSNGFISNVQVYSRIQLIPLTFWIFVILIAVYVLISDSGFFKIGAIIIVATGLFVLTLQMVNSTSSYDTITTDEYDLVVEIVWAPSNETFNVYEKENIFFSKFVGSITVADYYDKSYEVVGDSFIIQKCTEVSCITAEIDLE
ncbi:hypothetical protein OAO42_00105 [Candidatus Izimaplasma bacterium]|nr:hypothetical protein [Candidatus Izimaplasma bacterium]